MAETLWKRCDERKDYGCIHGWCPHAEHDHSGLVPVAPGSVLIEHPEGLADRVAAAISRALPDEVADPSLAITDLTNAVMAVILAAIFPADIMPSTYAGSLLSQQNDGDMPQGKR